MAKRYYLGLDNGTTGTTAMLFDEAWRPVGRGYQELTQSFPKSGWAEQNAEEIWQSVPAVVSSACRMAGIRPEEITCLGLANVGETVVLWDRFTGTPVYPAISWQDRRTAGFCEELEKKSGGLVRDIAGIRADSYFSASKVRWIMDHVEGVRAGIEAGRILAGTLDGWLFWKMTGGKVFSTDPSTASRTLFMNLKTGTWDERLLDLFGVRRAMLPEIHESAGVLGYTDPASFLGARIPISGGAVDQQAALFGQACFVPGMTKCTYGTGCFMLMNTGEQPAWSTHGIVTTVAWKLGGKLTYALDGGVSTAGAAVQWLRDQLGLFSSPSETEEMALRAGSNGGVYFVPAFSGLAAPHWNPYAKGAVFGLSGATAREHLVRAALEGIAYQVKDVLDAMNADAPTPVRRLRADGGASVNAFLMQFQADILGIPIDVPEITETTALGAASLAALGAREIDSLEAVGNHWRLARTYEPHMSEDERQTLLAGWEAALRCVNTDSYK